MALIPYLTAEESPRNAASWNTLFEELDRKLNIALDNHSMCFWFSQVGGRFFEQFFGQCFFFHDTNPYFSTTIFQAEREGVFTKHQEDFSDYLPLGPSVPFDMRFDFVNYNHSPFVEAAQVTLQDSAFFTPSVDHARKIVRIQQVANTYYTQIGRNPNIKFSNIGLFHWSLEAMTKLVTNPSTGQTQPYRVFVRNDPGPELIYKYANVELIFEGSTYQNVVFPKNYNKFNFFRIHNLNGTAMNFTFKNSSNQNVFSLTIPAYGSKCVRRDSVDSGYIEGFSHFHRFKTGDYRFYCSPLTLGTQSGYNHVIGIKRGMMKSNNVVNPQLMFALTRKMELGGPAKWFLDTTKFWDASTIYSPQYFSAVAETTLLGDLLHHKGRLGLAKINTPTTSTRSFATFSGYGNIEQAFGDAGFTAVTIGDNDFTLTKTGTHDFLSVSTNLISARYGKPGQTFENSITLSCLAEHPDSAFAAQPLNDLAINNSFSYNNFVANTGTGTANNTGTQTQVVNTKAISEVGTGSGVVQIPFHRINLEGLKKLNHFGVTQFNSTNQDATYTTQTDRQVKLTGFGAILSWTKKISTRYRVTPGREFQVASPGVILSNTSTWGLIEFDGENLIRRKYVHFSGYGWPTWYPGTDKEGGANPMPAIHGAFNSPRKPPRFGRYNFILRGTSSVLDIYFPSAGVNFSVRQALHPDFNHTYLKATADDGTLKEKLPRRVKKVGIGVLSEFSVLNVYTLISAWAAGGFVTVNTNPSTGQAQVYDFATKDYTFYRNEILNNTPSNLSYLNGPLVFDRLPLMVDHYNNLASVVNAIHKVQPLHFSSFYDSTVSEGMSDEKGIFGTSIRPANQYSAVSGADGTNTVGYLTLATLGVPAKTAGNFPSSYQQLTSALYRRWRGAFEELATPLLDATWKKVLFGDPNASQGDYRWFTIDDVKTKATALGFKFYYQKAAIPLKLTITDATGTNLLYDGPINFGFTGEAPARFPAFVSCESESEIEWVKSIDIPRVRIDYQPADVFTFKSPEADVREIISDARWRKRFWAEVGDTTAQLTFKTQPLPSWDRNYHSLLFINHLPDGESSTSKVIAYSSPYVDFGSDFSRQSTNNALGRANLGLGVIPGTVRNTTDVPPTVLDAEAGNNFITAADTDFDCAELNFFMDTLKDA